MRILFLSALLLAALTGQAATKVTLLHFSDYHSHALPFYTDEGERGGVARAIGFLRREKRAGALVFSGGDTINKGAPAWSDKFGCADWPWFNGIVDAMAFGNHEADYGLDTFERCRAGVDYPILSANTKGFRDSAVFNVKGVRVGVFALAGADFPQLMKLPALQFSDPTAAARETVRRLREVEKADVVVMIGHQSVEDDEKLARAVPGIDVIFGSHSHLKRELTQIEGTSTAFISPSQYLSYVSRIELTVEGGRVQSVTGGLIPVDASMPTDRAVARRVRRMQRALEKDPQYKELFRPIARRDTPLSTEAVAHLAVETMRDAAKADVALSTRSSFRRPLPGGTLTMEMLRGALPYDNEIVVCTMNGVQLRGLLDAAGADSVIAGAGSIDPSHSYRVATTDYLAFVAYRDAFACEGVRTGLRVRDEVRKRLTR